MAFVVDPRSPYKVADMLIRQDDQQLIIVPDDPESMPMKAPIEHSGIKRLGYNA